MKPPRQTPDPEEAARFAETARAVGADADMETFRAALRAVGRHKPKEEKTDTPPKQHATGSE